MVGSSLDSLENTRHEEKRIPKQSCPAVPGARAGAAARAALPGGERHGGQTPAQTTHRAQQRARGRFLVGTAWTGRIVEGGLVYRLPARQSCCAPVAHGSRSPGCSTRLPAVLGCSGAARIHHAAAGESQSCQRLPRCDAPQALLREQELPSWC